MKAITISQPFASLIASGDKWVENRSWYTSYRGPLAIHAGKGSQYLTRSELGAYPTGCVIAVAKLAACVRLEDVPAKIAALSSVAGPEGSFRTWEEILGHRYAEGPFCWVLEDVRPVEHVAIRGAQGLWQLPDGLVLEEAKGGGW